MPTRTKIKMPLPGCSFSNKLMAAVTATVILISQANAQSKDDAQQTARMYTKKARSLFESNPKQSILYSDSAARQYAAIPDTKWEAISYQNISFAYDEGLHNLDSTYKYINIAKNLWEKINDSNGLANNLKYLGLIEGKMGKLKEAKNHINRAIELFSSTGFEAGVAVSHFDLAGVFEEEGKPDSSLVHYEINRKFFINSEDTSRIFTATNKILNLLFKKKDFKKAGKEFESNFALRGSEEVYWTNLMDFYAISLPYLKNIGYGKKYKQIKNALAKLKKAHPVKG